MEKEAKKDIKKNVATSASAAAGVAAGVFATAAFMPQDADADVVADVVTDENDATVPAPATYHYASPAPHKPRPQVQIEEASAPDENPEEQSEVVPDAEVQNEQVEGGEIEVLSYVREHYEDGSVLDGATVVEHGVATTYVDDDLDGMADTRWADVNENGEIDAGEVQDVSAMHIAMAPFQEAADFDPLYAKNDIPDYINDADVDNFMA